MAGLSARSDPLTNHWAGEGGAFFQTTTDKVGGGSLALSPLTSEDQRPLSIDPCRNKRVHQSSALGLWNAAERHDKHARCVEP